LKLWPSLLFGGVLAVTLIPLAQLTLQGSLTQYFNDISIFSEKFLTSVGKTNSLIDLWTIYWKIYGMHLNPVYLFVHGEGSVMYLTKFCGLFSWLDIAGLIAGIVWTVQFFKSPQTSAEEKQFLPFLGLALLAFFLGIMPVGFTHYNVPSVMRISGAWPFAMMFTAFFIWRYSLKIRGLGIALIVLACFFFGAL